MRTRLNIGLAVGDTSATGAIPTTLPVAGKQAAPGANSRFNVSFKQVESVALRLCEDKGLSTSIKRAARNVKDFAVWREWLLGKMLESSIERKYKESACRTRS